MALQLTTFKTKEETAQALAHQVSKDLQEALATSLEPIAARVLLLLSGGRSPLPFFTALSQQTLPWRQIDLSLVDERSVPFNHPDSNAGLIAQHVLQGPAAAANLLPLMATEVDASDAWRWAQRSAEIANGKLELKQPAVVVLGIGNDGHTASLFADSPQWPEISTTDQRYVAVQPGAAPHARVSLSLHALIAQRTCYVWSNGADKLDVIQQAQAQSAALAASPTDAAARQSAGPFALLVAHPDVMLKVFHSEQ